MDVPTLITECLVLAVLFVAIVGSIVTKDPASMVTDYPPEIQEEYYRTHPRKREQLTHGAIVRKVSALVVAAFVFAWMAHLAGATGFVQGSLVSFLYVAWIGAFDTFILDWIFFPRVKRWRLPGTEHMDKAYAQKWFHLKGVLQVLPLGIVYAVVCGLLVAWIF